MLSFTDGDMFETPADIRVNTVNCVGVMGAGVALAFKTKYPEMFRDYKKACEANEVKPGKLHIWKNLTGDWIINFPTKRHWREKSRYEDIEAGLVALRAYLAEQGSVTVTLPALGSGHGKLDWNRVSQMIRDYLADLDAKIIVFNPQHSRELGQKVKREQEQNLLADGVTIWNADNNLFPEHLKDTNYKKLYLKGNTALLKRPLISIMPSIKPTDVEVEQTLIWVKAVARPGITIISGYDQHIGRPILEAALSSGADVAICFPEGIIRFKLRQDLEPVWSDDRAVILSTAKPEFRWNPKLASESRELRFSLGNVVVITDASPFWLGEYLRLQRQSVMPDIFYLTSIAINPRTQPILDKAAAQPLTNNSLTGNPDVKPILALLNIPPDNQQVPLTNTEENYQQLETSPSPAPQTAESSSLSHYQLTETDKMTYPKRLIEVDLPIKKISAHARREKSIRHGHISTLHIWWARRPLAACRTAICAALWPDPADDLCPRSFREAAATALATFAEQVRRDADLAGLVADHWQRWHRTNAATFQNLHHPAEYADMREALLDFVADFANWDASTVPAFLETARALTQAAHEALGGLPGTRPLVVDPFAGGGAIPLEALRVGADAFASDLNPVAVLLNKVVLEYIPKYGKAEFRMTNDEGQEIVLNGLAEAVRYWGNWIKAQAEKELAEFYPPDPDGATPIAYLWARTIISEAPDDGSGIPVEVPLIRSLWLAKKTGRNVALRWVRDGKGRVRTETVTVNYERRMMNDETSKNSSFTVHHSAMVVRRPLLEIFVPKKASEVEDGTVARGSATCPVTGYTTPVESVRRQLKTRRGGAADARLLAVVTTRPDEPGRFYRLPTERDLTAAQKAATELERKKNDERRMMKDDSKTDSSFIVHPSSLSLVPDEPLDVRGIRHTWAMIYGLDTWGDLFTPRQALALSTLARLVAGLNANHGTINERYGTAVQTCLALAVSRQTDYTSSICSWHLTGEKVNHTFGRQALPMVWDFTEVFPFSGSSGDFTGAVEWIGRVCESNTETGKKSGHAQIASATAHPMPDDAVHAVITDPPYYDAVPYAYLSDFFYVWLRRMLDHVHPDLFSAAAVPKDEEIVVDRPHELSNSTKDITFYERELTRAFAESRRILHPAGIGTIVFASKTTASWEAILQAVVEAGWIITGSWPIDTEMSTRIAAQGQARLASSVHLVCRPRENPDGSLNITSIGDWRDVLRELPDRIHAWLPRLAREGVVGADAIFACLGPALEIYSRYSRVEKASGEPVTLGEYLEYVWAAVSKEALGMVFEGADASGFEEDARLTAMWLWTLNTNDEGGMMKDESKTVASSGYTLEYDAARKIAQGLGAHLENLGHLVRIKGSDARLLPVSERTHHLFGQAGVEAAGGGARKRSAQLSFSDLGGDGPAEAATQEWGELAATSLGQTTLDRVHQSMLLFAAGRSEALRRFLVEEGVGQDTRYWSLANALSALYPPATEEKRWVDGVLARKKGLGF